MKSVKVKRARDKAQSVAKYTQTMAFGQSRRLVTDGLGDSQS